MMGRMSEGVRSRVVHLSVVRGMKPTEIRKVLLEEDVNVTRESISRFLSKYRRTGRLMPTSRPRKASKLSKYYSLIDQLYENDFELAAVDIQRILKELVDVDASLTTIKRVRRKLGWVKCNAKFCQMIRIPNRQKRLDFCTHLQSTKDQFDNLIFSDGRCTVSSRITILCPCLLSWPGSGFRRTTCTGGRLHQRVLTSTPLRWSGII